MIGIITYISVLERTKEIGILRAIGASKRDISRIFNAETAIVGFASGLLGIIVTLILIMIANPILQTVTGIGSLRAILPAIGAIILVLLSVSLTMIAGVIPSRFAAKKDPVVALRSE
jgi:putative ABC transport system permease protein